MGHTYQGFRVPNTDSDGDPWLNAGTRLLLTDTGTVNHSSIVVVQIDDEEFLLPLENIQRARIVPVFE